MKVFVYGCGVEEERYFEECRKRFSMEIETCPNKAVMQNTHLAKGYPCISVLSTPIPKELIEELYAQGVRFISTRTIGFDHIDIETCKRLGIHVSNVTYSPESVADYTIMLLLMTLRNMKLIMQSAISQDYSFKCVQGRNLKGKCVGVIGAGNIASCLIAHLYGFGCKILVHAPHEKETLLPYATFVDLDTLYQESDIITLHVPLNEQTRHMICKESIDKMKDGVVLINTARGALVNNESLITAIEEGKVFGAALDVVEGETGIYYNNRKGYISKQREMLILNGFHNVIMSPHMAFLTEESSEDMVVNSMLSCKAFYEHEEDAYRIC
ncbi:D-isomer specific 2-hydroxyacid dehydrogenase family protein [Amedibacillus sp. YH-ame6]